MVTTPIQLSLLLVTVCLAHLNIFLKEDSKLSRDSRGFEYLFSFFLSFFFFDVVAGVEYNSSPVHEISQLEGIAGFFFRGS
jgi:hypothetical protein